MCRIIFETWKTKQKYSPILYFPICRLFLCTFLFSLVSTFSLFMHLSIYASVTLKRLNQRFHYPEWPRIGWFRVGMESVWRCDWTELKQTYLRAFNTLLYILEAVSLHVMNMWISPRNELKSWSWWRQKEETLDLSLLYPESYLLALSTFLSVKRPLSDEQNSLYSGNCGIPVSNYFFYM